MFKIITKAFVSIFATIVNKKEKSESDTTLPKKTKQTMVKVWVKEAQKGMKVEVLTERQ